MCGFAGVLTSDRRATDSLECTLDEMNDALVHRGPDDAGTWTDHDAGVGLAFRRLAIVDLSEHGHQPMKSATGRFTLVFNGEVYNHADLRRDLSAAGHRFRGHSDTETILAAFEHWGIHRSVPRFVGMFAIAVWDAQERTLTLIRDRLGIKPLFIYARPGHIMFASELKALRASRTFNASLNRNAVEAYLRYLYLPGPESIYSGVMKLPPGHILTIRSAADALPSSEPYWSVEDAIARATAAPFAGDEHEAIDELEQLLRDSIRLRLQADVPVGALLSGGIDSSTVVAIARSVSDSPLRTYSVGFDVEEYDETAAAAAVARHLGTDHHELRLTGRDALDVIPALPDLFDEPLADPSQIPTYLICGLARRDVTVALSGDGGDEVFAGYHRYLQGSRLIQRLARFPRGVLVAAGSAMGTVSANRWDQAYRVVHPLLPASLSHRLPGQKIAKLGAMLRTGSAHDMYRSLLSAWERPGDIMLTPNGDRSSVDAALERFAQLPLLERMMAADQLTYLPEDLLAKVDRASMAVSLEVRVPLLDHRVLELSWGLPRALKVRGDHGKWALRQVLHRYVPATLVDRPKMGFSVPVASWLRGPLRQWGEDLLFASGVRENEVLDRHALRRTWAGFQQGRSENAIGLWAVLMLEAWRHRWNV